MPHPNWSIVLADPLCFAQHGRADTKNSTWSSGGKFENQNKSRTLTNQRRASELFLSISAFTAQLRSWLVSSMFWNLKIWIFWNFPEFLINKVIMNHKRRAEKSEDAFKTTEYFIKRSTERFDNLYESGTTAPSSRFAPKIFCPFCKKNGENESYYASHSLKVNILIQIGKK